MKKTIVCVVLLSIYGIQAYAWNLGAKNINSLRLQKDGDIYFTLFERGRSGSEFLCQGTTTWMKIEQCPANDHVCISATDRMARTLLSAKLANKKVHVERSNCTVTEVALKS